MVHLWSGDPDVPFYDPVAVLLNRHPFIDCMGAVPVQLNPVFLQDRADITVEEPVDIIPAPDQLPGYRQFVGEPLVMALRVGGRSVIIFQYGPAAPGYEPYIQKIRSMGQGEIAVQGIQVPGQNRFLAVVHDPEERTHLPQAVFITAARLFQPQDAAGGRQRHIAGPGPDDAVIQEERAAVPFSPELSAVFDGCFKVLLRTFLQQRKKGNQLRQDNGIVAQIRRRDDGRQLFSILIRHDKSPFVGGTGFPGPDVH